jgi:hypothetical protein
LRNGTISERYGPQPAALPPVRGVRFGAVVLPLAALTEADRQQAIQHSQAVLAAAAEWLLGKQGIDAGVREGLPKYALDAEDPGMLIRRCAGESTHGSIKRGAFQVRS